MFRTGMARRCEGDSVMENDVLALPTEAPMDSVNLSFFVQGQPIPSGTMNSLRYRNSPS
ncbi:hypothetical protein [Tardiphaga sp. 709]|uniref:hypothetical protein n=1 Tax=Tardiphaga sp. 709 TaxID=3076039 RepID=UPI0028E28BE8|nr:hypothetical protein [Tardiphaga sp. 709]WNV09511.1 hypothetical protein RSO67_29335 [Tardiphaga sp. 709]